jgi:hypothetical protein
LLPAGGEVGAHGIDFDNELESSNAGIIVYFPAIVRGLHPSFSLVGDLGGEVGNLAMSRLLLAFAAGSLLWFGACADDPGSRPGVSRYALGADAGGNSCGALSYQGCCANGNTYHCQSNQVVATECPAGKSCGWHPSFNLYVCGGALFADPTGQVSAQCPSIKLPDAGPADAVSDTPSSADASAESMDATIGTCATLGYAGCCASETLFYCSLGKLISVGCGATPFCGWNGGTARYECGMAKDSSDPTGLAPRQCPPIAIDAGVAADLETTVDGMAADIPQQPDANTVPHEAGASDGFTLLDSFLVDTEVAPSDTVVVGLDYAGLDVGRLDYSLPPPTGGCSVPNAGRLPVVLEGWPQALGLLVVLFLLRRRFRYGRR